MALSRFNPNAPGAAQGLHAEYRRLAREYGDDRKDPVTGLSVRGCHQKAYEAEQQNKKRVRDEWLAKAEQQRKKNRIVLKAARAVARERLKMGG